MPVLIGAGSWPGLPRLRMFATAGFRPLWPVILFVPWLILGIAYLVESVRHRRAKAAPVVHGKVMSLLPAPPGGAIPRPRLEMHRRVGSKSDGVRDRVGTGCERSGESDDAEPRKYLPSQSARMRPDP